VVKATNSFNFTLHLGIYHDFCTLQLFFLSNWDGSRHRNMPKIAWIWETGVSSSAYKKTDSGDDIGNSSNKESCRVWRTSGLIGRPIAQVQISSYSTSARNVAGVHEGGYTGTVLEQSRHFNKSVPPFHQVTTTWKGSEIGTGRTAGRCFGAVGT
jgi:hypothetical protein